MLPQSYPNYKTVHRRFQTWCSNEVLRRVLTGVANELRDKGVLDEKESFIDATFAMAKGGGPRPRHFRSPTPTLVDVLGVCECDGGTVTYTAHAPRYRDTITSKNAVSDATSESRFPINLSGFSFRSRLVPDPCGIVKPER